MSVGIDATWLSPQFSLSGPVPCRADPEVAAFIQAAVDNRMELKLEQGLVLRINGRAFGQWYVTFYVTNDGTHRFYEMSGDGRLFTGSHPLHGPNEIEQALRYLRTW